MVQIIQSQPTQRQSALEQALGSALQNFGGAYMQGQQTLRQQALADQQMNLKLAEMGIDASAQDLRDYAAGTYKPKVISEGKEAVPAQYKDLQGPVQPGKQMGKMETAPAQEAVPAQYGPANPMLNYTQSKKAEMEHKKQLESIDLQGKLTDLEAKRFDIENKKELSPYTKRKMMADIDSQMLSMQKTRGDISKQPYELQKIQAETGKLQNERSGSKFDNALAETSGKELVKKTTNLFSVKAAMDNALAQLGDKNKSEAEKVKIGQGLLKLLNSAEGSDAVGAEEAKRIGDYLEYAYGNVTGVGPMRVGRDLNGFVNQVQNYSELLGERIRSNEQGLEAIRSGKPLSQVSSRPKAAQAVNAQMHPEVNQAAEWARANPNDPRAAEILSRIGG